MHNEGGLYSMTGKEILAHEFEKAGMRGYKAEQVDKFLEKIATYIDEQEVEKNDISYKITILADKLEEYKADESNIRDALLSAQKLGTSMLNEAKSKAEAMGREARQNAEDMLLQAQLQSEKLSRESLYRINLEVASTKKECEKERSHLDKIKKEVSQFKATILRQYKSHLDLLTNLPSVLDDAKAEDASKTNTPLKSMEKSESFAQLSQDQEPRPIKESTSFGHAQTIKSEIVTSADEMRAQELEQTREFTKEKETDIPFAPVENQNHEEHTDSELSESQRPNYMEKFGELKFGGYGKANK